jgi:predicted TIM-barrel fold metal-dependent hydrolase
MSHIVIASCDGHAGMPVSTYRDYFEKKYWPALDDLVVAEKRVLELSMEMTSFSPEQLELVDEGKAIRSGGLRGAWDPAVRLREMDREGIAWEMVYMGAGDGTTVVQSPFAWELSAPYPAELRSAGARAYNRWLADHIAQTDGRVSGAAMVGPCFDLDEEVRQLHWLAEHSLVAVYAPGTPADPDLPPLQDAYYEPFWAAAEDLGLRLAFHVNWGVPQRDRFTAHAEAYLQMKRDGLNLSSQQLKEKLLAEDPETFVDIDLPPRRAVWQLMLGGVFDRHPELGAVLTELRSDWTPEFIGHLDDRFAQGGLPLKMKPSEYWKRNFRLAPSFVHPIEMEMRHEIGIDQMMYGRDYPHPEGTWPNTWDWLRGALKGVPEDEARQFLGLNAIEWFGLDQAKLTEIAERIGPRPEDLLGDHQIDPRKIEAFHVRGGYSKPRQSVDLKEIDDVLDQDLRTLVA